MNKIVLDKEEVIVAKEDLDIVVSDYDTKVIYLCSQNKKICINYHIGEKSHLTVYHYSINGSFDIQVHLRSEGASIHYFYNTMNDDDNQFLFLTHHLASKTESYLVSHGVNTRDHALSFDISPSVSLNAKHCVCNQENSIINLKNGHSTICPNLLIDNYDVLSNHSAYIGTFREEELFYLMSRGLSREASYQIKMQNFLVKDREKLEQIFPKFLEKLKEL